MGHIWNWLFIPPIGFNDDPETVVANVGDEANDPRILLQEFTSSFLFLNKT